MNDIVVITENDGGMLQFSGTFERNDKVALLASAAVFVYLVDGDGESFAQAQGDIDYSTGEFTITVTGIPVGSSSLILSFVVLDPADTPDTQGANSVFSLDVANNDCSSPLTITLEIDNDITHFDLFDTEPGGIEVYPGEAGVSVWACHGQCSSGLLWLELGYYA